MLIFAPLINLRLQLENAMLKKTTDALFAKRSKRSDQASTSTASQPTPIASAENTSASWQPDPILIPTNFVSSGEADIAQMYRQHWPQI